MNSRDAEPAFGGDAQRAEGVGRAILFTLDVAGQDEAAFHDPEEQMLRNPGRDAVTLSIASVDLSELNTLQAPIFRILQRAQWTGLNHLDVFARLAALADRWHPQYIIVDATGVGEGLWAMLDKRYPTRVRPVKFSAQKKSEIGYRYLAMIETGRVRDCMDTRRGDLHGRPEEERAGINPAPTAVSRADVDRQYTACISEVLPGPQHTLRWGVPEGTRDENGSLIHDDIVLADALLAEADALPWTAHSPAVILRPKDPLDEMSHFR